jgi:hypothetical protein
LRGLLNSKIVKTRKLSELSKTEQNTLEKLNAELMLASSASVVALAKKMTKSDTKTVTRTISIPKTKVIKQPAQQTNKTSTSDAVRTTIKPTIPQKPLPNQQIS